MHNKTILLAALLGGPVTAAAAGLTLHVPEQDQARLSFLAAPNLSAELQIAGRAVQVTVGTAAPQTLLDDLDALQGDIVLTVADYNFDGHPDIGILESYGYGGVNQFMAVFVLDPDRQTYARWLTESNIEPDPERRELHTDQRSGPRQFVTVYRLHDGQPYPYRETVAIGLNVEKVTLRNEHGDITATQMTDLLHNGSSPALRTVSAERAYLHDQPADEARSNAYIVRGDRVELLDSAGSWDEWLRVRYRGKRVFEQWIKAETLSDEP